MKFRTLHKTVTYLAASLGLMGLTLGAGLSPWMTLAVALLVTMSWWAEGEKIRGDAYARRWTWLVFLFFGLQVFRGFGAASLLSLGIEFAAFLQVTRLFSRRTARDYQQVVVLAVLHLICASVLSTDLDFAIIFVGFLFVTPWMLALTHLRAEVENNYSRSDESQSVDRVLDSKRLAGPSLLFGTAFLALPLFFATTALFLIFPRVGMGFLTFDQDPGISVAGFGRNVELGRFGVIRDDPTVIMRVTFPEMEEISDEVEYLRLRGTSFDHYDGRQWTRSTVEGFRIRPTEHYYPVRPVARRLNHHPIEIEIDAMEEPVLFLPPDTVGFFIPPRMEAGQERSRLVRRSAGREFRYLDGDALGIRYTAYVTTEPSELIPERLAGEASSRYRQLPEAYTQIASQAQSIVEGAGTDAARAEALIAWLRDSGEFSYSLQMPEVPQDADPLHHFLFVSRYGHCEYFSTALAVMLRTLGIPTRNVTGFVGGRYNDFGDYFAIRNGDAHSWVEAHIDGRWVMFDPTPAGRAEAGPVDGPLAALAAFLDAMRSRWASDVVGYDLGDQASAFRRLVNWAARFGARQAERSQGRSDEPREPGAQGEGGDSPWGIIGLLLCFGLMLWLVWQSSFARRLRGGWGRDEPREVLLFRKMEKRLAKKGLVRPPSQTPLDHANALGETDFEARDEVMKITQAYLEARYGGRSSPAEEFEDLRASLARISVSRPPETQRLSSKSRGR